VRHGYEAYPGPGIPGPRQKGSADGGQAGDPGSQGPEQRDALADGLFEKMIGAMEVVSV
jgi:hypothetical protein